jgi:hypothetical protein
MATFSPASGRSGSTANEYRRSIEIVGVTEIGKRCQEPFSGRRLTSGYIDGGKRFLTPFSCTNMRGVQVVDNRKGDLKTTDPADGGRDGKGEAPAEPRLIARPRPGEIRFPNRQ